jgi:2-oxo-hept-3-ene-1,7-dioate hydratase
MTPDEIAQAAGMLLEAERTGRQCGLLSLRYPQMTLDDAYAVQAALVARKRAAGARVIGWKIGLTSRAMQQALQIDTPDSGVLLDDMLFSDGGTGPAGRFIQPRIEAEIAFVMKAPLAGAGVTRAEVLAATDHVAPSLEILDTRILRADPTTGKARIITDTVSDNAANAGVVLGSQRHAVDAVDLRWVGAIVTRDGVVEETGLGAGVLNDPVTGILWLVHRLARYGQGIKAGQILLSGSFIRPIEAPPGSRFLADFGPFGKVRLDFEGCDGL